MKKIVNLLSLAGIIAAPCIIANLYFQETPISQEIATASLISEDSPEACPLNQTRFVNFQAEPDNFARLTQREQMDQLRDWLLFAVVSDQGLSTHELTQSLYDLSTIRDGYTKPVSSFEYGQTRSLYIGNGTVIALVPQEPSQGERMDDLAHIVDKHRKNLGEIPTTVKVFGYEIDLEQQSAFLTQGAEIDAKILFTQEYGYYETTVNTLEDLQRFMGWVNDVTFAQVQDENLILGGRKTISRDYRGIRVEDVAALWQSEKNIEVELAQFNARWQEKSRNTSSGQYEKLQQEAEAEWRNLKLVNGSGFSLDPNYDYGMLDTMIARTKSSLLRLTSNGLPAVNPAEIEAIEVGLSENNVVPYLTLVEKLKTMPNLTLGQLDSRQDLMAFVDSIQTASFQAARYDGDLEGTEVGMVLFYTDLLAKLWALDYISSAPDQYIQDFKSLTHVKVSSIYEQEEREFAYTRLWFGIQDKGFQVTDEGNRMLFARNATRIYAASSNPLQPGVETTASASSEAFLGWWNDHYEEVARYEPEYERLNEIMKWSLLISWLNESEQGHRLSFLQQVPVKRDNWFPDWVGQNSASLKFKHWSQVGFYNRGSKNAQTETMPRLVSDAFQKFGESRYLSGGVSLADRAVFEKRGTLPTDKTINPLARRSDLDYNSVNSSKDRLQVTTLGGTTYEVETSKGNVSFVKAEAKQGTRFRSRDAELLEQEFSRTISQSSTGIQIDTAVGDTELGRFNVNHTQNGFTVGFRSRDIDNSYALGLDLSRYKGSVENALQENPDVLVAFKSRGTSKEYIVQMANSKKWLRIMPEIQDNFSLGFGGGGNSGGGGLPPDNGDFVVGGFDDSSRNFRLAWIDEQVVKQAQTTENLIEFKRSLPVVPEEPTIREFGEDIRSANYDKVAQEMGDNPTQFHQRKTAHLKVGLQKTNHLLKQGKIAEADQVLNDLIPVHGAEPKLMMYKALIELSQDRLIAKQVFPLDSDQSPNFLDEFKGFVQRSDGNLKRIETDNAFYYVIDDPWLSNVDWNVPLEDSLPSGSSARVYQLSPGEIGEVKLHQSGLGDAEASVHTSTEFKGSNRSNSLAAIRHSTRRLANRESTCLQEKPVYVVILPDQS